MSGSEAHTTGRLYLGIDASTTAVKAIAWDSCGTPVATGRAELTTESPAPGLAEQDAESWWTATAAAIRDCLASSVRADQVTAAGLTVQRETFVLLDDQARPLHPAILWYDARGAECLAQLTRERGRGRYHRATGKQLDVTAAAAKLRHLAKHDGAHLTRACHFADVLAFLAYRLTGRLVTTPAGADTTGLIDLHNAGWLDAHLALARLEARQMPALVAPGERLGTLSREAAAACGLRPGLPIVAGGGDGHCFALAATAGRTDLASFTLGTSAVLGLTVDRPLLGRSFRTLIACQPGHFLLESVIQCGSATVAWLHGQFLRSVGSCSTPADLESACAALPPGSDGLLVLPHWRGARVPHNDADARGVVLGWTDRHTAVHFQRAIMEGIALEAAALLRSVGRRAQTRVNGLVLGGGGAASDCWCQILAGATGLPVCRPESVETASLGAAILAMAATQGCRAADVAANLAVRETVFRPHSHEARAYGRLRALHRRLYSATRDFSHALTRL